MLRSCALRVDAGALFRQFRKTEEAFPVPVLHRPAVREPSGRNHLPVASGVFQLLTSPLAFLRGVDVRLPQGVQRGPRSIGKSGRRTLCGASNDSAGPRR